MTREEKIAKQYLRRVLNTDGYPTYSKIFEKFDFNFTNDPGVVAYLDPKKGVIVANRGLNENQISTIIRHEILHDYLRHEKRLLDKLAKDRGLNPDELDDIAIKDLEKDLYSNADFNIAADYEISNRGYTDKDKKTVREIELNGRQLSGLVTEDDHPEWVELSVEEMFDELRKERKKVKPEDNAILGQMSPDGGYFVAADGTVYASPEAIKQFEEMIG